MRKLIALVLSLCLFIPASFSAQDLYVIGTKDETKFQGLYSNPSPDKIPNGAHSKFDDVYVKDGNIQVAQGRDRLNTSANADTDVNGIFYYENSAGTKKIIVRESDEVVSYTTSGGSRTSLVGSLTDEVGDFTQIGDTLYFTSATNGLYKWTGTGSASAIAGVNTPSAVDFSATSGVGGLTSGEPSAVTANLSTASGCNTLCDGSTAIDSDCVYISSEDMEGTNVTTDTGINVIAATTSTYLYKVTSFNPTWGIESEASTADTATLTGAQYITWNATNCAPCDFQGAGDATCDNTCCTGIEYAVVGAQTKTTGTTAAAPSAPFSNYRIYRTVAGGSEYFLVGEAAASTAFPDGKADASLGTPLDTTIDTITPPTYKYIAGYLGSIFLAEGSTIQFNRLPVDATTSADTYWLETDKITLPSNQVITGMKAAKNSLYVFTSDAIYEITGFGINNLRVQPVVLGIGAVANNTIELDSNGDIIFFAGTAGVYKLQVGQQLSDTKTGTIINRSDTTITKLSAQLKDVFKGINSDIDLDETTYTSAHAYYDRDNELYFLYINNDCFIYDSVNQSWSHLPATHMNGSVYVWSANSAGQGVIVDNYGFFYNNWSGWRVGVEGGTVTGSPTSATGNTLTDTGATFYTTDDGLTGAWVYVDNDNGEWRQIASNTATALTVSANWTTNPTTADTYYIGYLHPNFQTKQYGLDPPKRIQPHKFYLLHNKADAAQTVNFYMYSDKDVTVIDNDPDVDLNSNFVDIRFIPALGYWWEAEVEAFVYSDDATDNPALDILGYALRAEQLREE